MPCRGSWLAVTKKVDYCKHNESTYRDILATAGPAQLFTSKILSSFLVRTRSVDTSDRGVDTKAEGEQRAVFSMQTPSRPLLKRPAELLLRDRMCDVLRQKGERKRTLPFKTSNSIRTPARKRNKVVKLNGQYALYSMF